MNLSRFLVFAVLFVSAVSGVALDRNAFTFSHYSLQIRIEPEQQRFAARGVITLRNDSDQPQRNAVLQISSSLDWRSIRMGDTRVQFLSQTYTSDIDHTGALSEAIVTLPHEIAPHKSVDLAIGYEGVIALEATRLTRIGVPQERALHSDWDQIGPAFTAVRGVGYVTWYPVAMEAASLSQGNSVFETVGRWKTREAGSEMSLSFSSTSQQIFLVNGMQASSGVSPADSNNGGTNSISISDTLGLNPPAFLLGDYQLMERPGISKIYYLHGHENAARIYADEFSKINDFSGWLGKSREPVTVADLPDVNAGPFESAQMLLSPLSTDTQFIDITLVHAVTHSHFRSPRPWIDEGMAHFMQALWREQQSGRQAALDYMGLHRTALAEAEKAAAERKNSVSEQSLISTSDEEYYRSKAMFVFWMLRDMVGDAVFRKAISTYDPQQDNRTSYLQKLIEAQTHRDLEWFFDDWVYRDRGLPDFRVASSYTRQMLNGAYLVTITIENLGAAGAEVPLRVGIQGGDVASKVEVHAKASAVVRVEAPNPPLEITVNDGGVPESNMGNNSFEVRTESK